jgi:hypothetical protein
MMDALTLDQIRVFLSVVDEGSFPKAAKSLQRAQSATGNLGEVSWIWLAASIEADDEVDAKLMADPEYQAVYKKFGPLLVPNARFDKIYRHH